MLETTELETYFLDMWRIRRFEERAAELFKSGVIKGTAHSCVGQEAIAVGACAGLGDDDYIVSHHRGHGHCIAKGADTGKMMAELFGRITGYGHGLGGSMHIAALDRGILGANGIVGAGLGIGTGAALSATIRGTRQVCVAFFGDGAANEGIFHESLNLAALWKLPVIFVCENNGYGLSLGVEQASAVPRISTRAVAYGMPGETIDGNDAVVVRDAVGIAVQRARAGEGPSLIEAMTYRSGDHSMRTNLPRYRPEAEEEEWRRRDPILKMTALLKQRQVSQKRIDAIAAKADAEIEQVIAAAGQAPEPAMDILFPAVMAPSLAAASEPEAGSRQLGYVEAVREAMHQEMARDDHVVVLGEDVGRIGGLFQCTAGLQQAFGAERVRDTPISENVIANAAVGAALTGLRPIVEVQFFDFITHMMDAIVNQAAKLRFMLGGEARIPLVIRGPQGGGIRLGAQHSQSLETWFAHIPGLVVLAPSNPYDAKGLLAAAIRDDNPVVFIEHKLLYQQSRGPVPKAPYALPIGKAAIRRPGKDVTIVATMAMVDVALSAARELARDGIEAEVIDPRTLRPLDGGTILASVRKTNRCVVVHEGWTTHGFGAEISALIMENAFDWLDAPVARVGMADVPMPYNSGLERELIPNAARIAEAARTVCYRS
ncbi:Dehydrogenase E1 component [Mesorhizobium metallidurans STM 2683]|uniref:2-oxoglutarate dehydrogenase E1 component n=1 Tax=Mesorhizobium metallidurans STM 2683 TaxID=1297569 RepID=M5ESH0_9HYPH|nr:dehydrogenase E1 component subunit alpha/beta [Mesorhizobium metallidurans]CCV07232.1 Dehydrogenase E1 component [Mesorhizobium metallidurans STM 2683]